MPSFRSGLTLAVLLLLPGPGLVAMNAPTLTLANQSMADWTIAFPEASTDQAHLSIRDTQNPFLAPDALQGGRPFILLANHTYLISYELNRKHLLLPDPPSARTFTLADDSRTLAASEEFIFGFPSELVHVRRGPSRQRLEHRILELKAGRRKDLVITIRKDRFD